MPAIQPMTEAKQLGAQSYQGAKEIQGVLESPLVDISP